jgi:hypothetical protein
VFVSAFESSNYADLKNPLRQLDIRLHSLNECRKICTRARKTKMNTLYLIQLTFFQPKYTGKLLESKKKRDLENLLRDERKQAKERKAEGEEFKDKDVFVTSAYRKQLEETVKFRKELEDSDKIDGKPLEG